MEAVGCMLSTRRGFAVEDPEVECNDRSCRGELHGRRLPAGVGL